MNSRHLDDLPRPGSTMGSFLRDATERFGDRPFLIDGNGRTLSRAGIVCEGCDKPVDVVRARRVFVRGVLVCPRPHQEEQQIDRTG